MGPDEFLAELERALDNYRFDDVGPLLERVDPAEFDSGQVKRTLGLIRRKRLFAELERAASLFSLAGHPQPVVRRQWAQALLDQNRIPAALTALRVLQPQVQDDPAEGPEVRGLIGRALKQRFVNEGKPDDLVRAIRAYREDWTRDPEKNRWHGINLAALLERAAREGVDPGESPNPEEIAGRILRDIGDLDEPALWDYATAMEAAVALGDKKTALLWAKRYATHPRADAFELGSTLRQMKEIWQLEGSDLGGALLPVLEYELLQREGATLPLPCPASSAEGFEAVYGSEGSLLLDWMETMFRRCRAIGRVFDPAAGEPLGTGFLVRAKHLRDQWGDRCLFLTNSHVVSAADADEAPLAPGQGAAEFTRLAGSPKIPLGEILFSSPRVNLDVSVLALGQDPPADAEILEPSDYAPALPKAGEPQRIYVIGHPDGRDLTVTLYDNDLAEYEGPYVRYRSPTKGGNSGSPVFNRRWQSFAIHHRARKEKQLNEGVLFEAIKKTVAALP